MNLMTMKAYLCADMFFQAFRDYFKCYTTDFLFNREPKIMHTSHSTNNSARLDLNSHLLFTFEFFGLSFSLSIF